MKIDYYTFPRLYPEKNIRDYCQAVYLTLLFWVRTHSNPEWWEPGWLSVYEGSSDEKSVEYFLAEIRDGSNGRVGNDYFDFDLKTALIRKEAEKNRDEYDWCESCNWWADNCECEEPNIAEPDIETVIDIIESTGEWGRSATWDEITELFRTEVFAAYRQGVAYLTNPIIEEIGYLLRQIHQARSNVDLLAAVQAGTQIWHVNGQVVKDYGDRYDLSDGQINDIRNDGLTAWFGEEEAAEWLEEEFEPLDYLDEEFDSEPIFV